MDNDVFQEQVDVEESSTNEIAPGEIIIGMLQGLNSQGEPLVNFAENISSSPVLALSTISLKQLHSGRQVALLFAQGDFSKPVIIGLLHSPLLEMIDSFNSDPEQSNFETKENKIQSKENRIEDVYVDGKKVVIEGKEEIVLTCGEASITLTKAGKILIRGKFISNRSSGVNRLLGASIQIN